MKGKGSGGIAISCWSNNYHFWSMEDIISPLIAMHENKLQYGNCDALAVQVTRESAYLLVLGHADFRPLNFVHA